MDKIKIEIRAQEIMQDLSNPFHPGEDNIPLDALRSEVIQQLTNDMRAKSYRAGHDGDRQLGELRKLNEQASPVVTRVIKMLAEDELKKNAAGDWESRLDRAMTFVSDAIAQHQLAETATRG